MALGAGSLLKTPTALQLLLEEINFQRTKEMRQLLKDESGFVVLQGTTYWTDLFVRHFLFQTEPEHAIDSDDLLFFVRKKHVKGSSRHMPKYDTEVDVFRKDSRKLPIGDPDVDWEETVYLNLVIHQFNYTLTLAICTRTSPKELQVLRRHSQRVYASPSRRKMDTKGDGEEMTYPHICFMVDNFDEVFSDILVRDGEMVCVELVASDRDGSVQGVIFLGSIRYDALKKVYDARQSSLSSKVAQRMTFGLFNSGGPQTRCEFVRMKGPQGKGHAEMAVTKPKGSGVETPTSEPGFCATDMWDEWEDEGDEAVYNTRHQRRLSDPSSNLAYFNRHGWRTKTGGESMSAAQKTRSENEGLDTLASEVSEIEGGDLRDDRPASSASDTNLSTMLTQRWHKRGMIDNNRCPPMLAPPLQPPLPPSSTTTPPITPPPDTLSCCNCFSPRKRLSTATSAQMSEVYCRTCDEANSPACLANITPKKTRPKHRNLLTVESEIELPNGKKAIKSITAKKETSGGDSVDSQTIAAKTATATTINNNKSKSEEYELADDATSLNGDHIAGDESTKIGVLNEFDAKLMIRVHGREELPAEQTNSRPNSVCITNVVDNRVVVVDRQDLNGNKGGPPPTNGSVATAAAAKRNHNYSTLPKRKRSVTATAGGTSSNGRSTMRVPQRQTPDGTTIYYWCDVPKRILKFELDDGAYNPLWAMRGFTQSFHFWKENRRQQSVPLNAFLTYVTLPWWSIAKDLLDHRETPILTF